MAAYDHVLTQEISWPYLGINERKMAFFGGDTRDIGYLAYSNKEILLNECYGKKSEEKTEATA